LPAGRERKEVETVTKSDRIRLVVCGGEVTFAAGDYGARLPPVYFAKGAPLCLLAACGLLALVPLMFVQSNFGTIDFRYPPEYLDRSPTEQYALAFLDNLSIITRAHKGLEAPYSDALPEPENPVTRRLVGILVVIADTLAIAAIVYAVTVFCRNISRMKRSRDNLTDHSLRKEIHHECILSNLSR
jgi:hypothetical protein